MQQKALINFRKREILPTKLKRETFGYKAYSITPSRFIESGEALKQILDTASAIHEGMFKYDYLNKSFVINQSSPIYYEVLYEGKNISFNYIIPDKYTEVLVNKIDRVFRVAAVKELEEDYFHNFVNKYYCTFAQKKHFMFSLNTNADDSLLENLLSVINSVQPDDKVLLQVALNPLNEKWKEDWAKANIKRKNGEELAVHPSKAISVIESIMGTVENALDLVDIIVGVDKKEKEAYSKKEKQIDSWGGNMYRNANLTKQKINGNGFECQIRLYCTSEERTRYYQKIFSGVFKVLDAEQELEFTTIGKHKSKDREFEGHLTSKNVFSTKEIMPFLRLPNRKMQGDFKESMKAIQITEVPIPEELLNGEIPIGEASYKENKFIAYWNTRNKDIAAMHKILAGMQRAGKTNYLIHFAIKSMKAGQSVFVIDSIKNCELADAIRDHLPPEFHHKIIVLDYSNLDYLLSLAWSELRKHQGETDKKHRMMLASQIAGNLESFIESVGAGSVQEKFSARMKRFLACAAKLVLSQEGTNIKDVLDVLQERDIRDEFIERSGLPESNIIVQELRRLDDPKTEGTRYDLIGGIIDRASIMTNDYLMELLLSVKPNDEIDFRYWADNGYCVLIKVSELKVSRTALRPLVSFIYSKLWLSMFSRGEQKSPRITNVILDEIHNFPEVCNMIKGNCRESAKYGLSYVFTSHMLTDLKGLLPIIKGSGASFMLFKTTKENLRLLEEELMQGGITIEEALELKKFHTINIVNYDREYAVFTTKAPDLIDKCYKLIDRSHIDLECSMKYGSPFED